VCVCVCVGQATTVQKRLMKAQTNFASASSRGVENGDSKAFYAVAAKSG